ncbi:uncharacterized protein EAE98_008803 [Botrytis deweyae]|uniref:Uncharacterized protein n=1 Tax=Botrytis deweyae TaxID=2478750 RepID=A0ABQ7ID60_9HELO|nr:uncharacterized protein EAE98_008803 [Botrytis deweyae]KAF7920774.1 hypothetical protein EAE98_008803 [Botrytis deweyae]
MGSKTPISDATLAMRPSTTAFFEKKKVAGNVIPAMQPLVASSLNKNKTINNAAPAMRPSAAAFFKKDKTANPFLAAAAKHKPQPIVDLDTLTQNPAIAIISNKEITIYIEMCGFMDDAPTDMVALCAALTEYKTIKKLSIKIHAPWPHTQSKEAYNNSVSSMKKLFAIIDGFNLYKLRVTMSIDKDNFPQMKLGAAIHGLRFKKWQLFYQVYNEVNEIDDDPIQIFRGSEYDLRLRGVWKKEFLAQA